MKDLYRQPISTIETVWTALTAKNIRTTFFFLFILNFSGAQTLQEQLRPDILRIGFYNCENFYDYLDDTLKNDDAFLPEGSHRWTKSRFYKKVHAVGRVILNMGGWEAPDIVGLCEIENDFVLQNLTRNSPLKNVHYRFIRYATPDLRGMGTALIFRDKKLELLYSMPIPVVFPFDSTAKNRDILYAVFECFSKDTLHVFVNHWTSRFGGYSATMAKRHFYAQVLRQKTDSLLSENPNASIIILGDFNDYPTDESMQLLTSEKLVNLMLPYHIKGQFGTHKMAEFWGCLDQIIVSPALLNTNSCLQITSEKAQIFNADFLLIPDEKYGGTKNFRTYLGPKYIGGYSDHLPVYVDLREEKRY